MGAPPPSAGPAASSDAPARSASFREDEPVEEPPDEDHEAAMMAQMMGFSAFDSTAGKDVGDPRCKMEAVKKKEQRKYRQYMNRRGGFNRPLDEV